jgi:hypothetical protein
MAAFREEEIRFAPPTTATCLTQDDAYPLQVNMAET